MKRAKIIQNLPRLDNDPIFKINKEKINFKNLRKSKIIKTNSFRSDKKPWFNLWKWIYLNNKIIYE